MPAKKTPQKLALKISAFPISDPKIAPVAPPPTSTPDPTELLTGPIASASYEPALRSLIHPKPMMHHKPMHHMPMHHMPMAHHKPMHHMPMHHMPMMHHKPMHHMPMAHHRPKHHMPKHHGPCCFCECESIEAVAKVAIAAITALVEAAKKRC